MRIETKNGWRYYIVDEENEISYPSVTSILGKTTDKSGIKRWEERVGIEEAARISKFSANRGSFMHSLLEHMLNAKFVFNTEFQIKDIYKSAVEDNKELSVEEYKCGSKLFNQFSFTSFYDLIDSVVYQETPVWCERYKYAGRLDLVIRDKAGHLVLIDFKTSKKPKKEIYIINYFLQVAAYSNALYVRYGEFPQRAEIWISCETGEVQTFVVSGEDLKKWFKEFGKLADKFHQDI